MREAFAVCVMLAVATIPSRSCYLPSDLKYHPSSDGATHFSPLCLHLYPGILLPQSLEMGQTSSAVSPSQLESEDELFADWVEPTKDDYRAHPRDYLEESLEFPSSTRSFTPLKRQALLAEHANLIRDNVPEVATDPGSASACDFLTDAEVEKILRDSGPQPDLLKGMSWGQRLAFLLYKAGAQGLNKTELWHLTVVYGQGVSHAPWMYAVSGCDFCLYFEE